jgi:hypothetical protein
LFKHIVIESAGHVRTGQSGTDFAAMRRSGYQNNLDVKQSGLLSESAEANLKQAKLTGILY